MCEQGKVKIPLENYEEITPEKQELILWLKRNEHILTLVEPARQELVARVVEEGYASDLTDEEIEKIGNDPFLIAYALADVGRRCVVTTNTQDQGGPEQTDIFLTCAVISVSGASTRSS